MRLERRLERRIAIRNLCSIVAVVVADTSVGGCGGRGGFASGDHSFEEGRLANWGGICTSGQASIHVSSLICFVVYIPFGIRDVGKYLQNRPV